MGFPHVRFQPRGWTTAGKPRNAKECVPMYKLFYKAYETKQKGKGVEFIIAKIRTFAEFSGCEQ